MRVLISMVALLALLAIPARPAQAALQFTLWPADFSYGTPSGTFAWSSTMFGFRFDEPLGPLVSLRSDLRYGSVANFSFPGAPSNYSGSTWIADSVVRVGLRTGPVGLAAYGGYGGLFFNANGPTASDNVVLRNLAGRLGVEATFATSQGLTLRGSYTWITSLDANAGISMTTPPVAASWSGSGSGSEYEIALQYSPVPVTTVFAGYRGGTSQISWSGAGTTSTTFHGYLVGVELHF